MSGVTGKRLFLNEEFAAYPDHVTDDSPFAFEYDAQAHQLVIEMKFGVSSTKIFVPLQDLSRLEQVLKEARQAVPKTVGGMVPTPNDTVPTLLSPGTFTFNREYPELHKINSSGYDVAKAIALYDEGMISKDSVMKASRSLAILEDVYCYTQLDKPIEINDFVYDAAGNKVGVCMSKPDPDGFSKVWLQLPHMAQAVKMKNVHEWSAYAEYGAAILDVRAQEVPVADDDVGPDMVVGG